MGEAEVRVRVPGEEGGYPVHVEPGALDALGDLCRRHVGAHRYAVIADATVAELYGDAVVGELAKAAGGEGRAAGLEPGTGAAAAGAELFTFPPGEASKSREEWARLTDAMLEAGFGRDAAVAALGGGVAGDLAGFVAATYMRGLPVVQLPTTLLAMLDSSVGGKTAVDTPRGKNLVGAFHHPALVVADPRVLESLPARQLAAGLAEAVKAASIADEALFGWMEDEADALRRGEPEAVAPLVRRGVAIKARVVEEDPEEAGLRQVLNFGHTVAHALESLSGYDLLHGEAVAAGMRVEARLGEEMGATRPGTARRLARLLSAVGLGEEWEAPYGAPAVLEAAATDKKAREGRVRFVLLEEIGEVARGEEGGYAHPLPLPRGREEELLAAALSPPG